MTEQMTSVETPTASGGAIHAETAGPKRVLAVASGGGHWVQLKRLWQAFEGQELIVVTTDAGYEDEVDCHAFHVVTDANMQSKIRLVRLAMEMALIVFRERPEVVISTGAAPGYFALRFGKMVGARTIWVDSLANAEVLSMSGMKVQRYADLWLTQWPHLAKGQGPYYFGSVV